MASDSTHSGMLVDRGAIGVVVGPVADGLDAAGRGASPDGDQDAGLLAQLLDGVDVLRRADRALDEDDVVRAGRAARRGLGELDDVEPGDDLQQLVFEVEDA